MSSRGRSEGSVIPGQRPLSALPVCVGCQEVKAAKRGTGETGERAGEKEDWNRRRWQQQQLSGCLFELGFAQKPAKMVASGDFTSSDGPGGKASRVLDAVVAFVVGIFQPIFGFLSSAIFTRKPRQHNNQNRDRDNTLGDSPHNNVGDHNDPRPNPDGQDDDHQGDSSLESMQRHSSTPRPQHAYGPKVANGNAPPAVKPVLPQVGPAVNASRPAKQDGAPTNGVAAKTALGDVTNGVNHTSKHHVVGEEEAEENLHDQVDLAPAVQPVDGEEEPEDPVKAAERAIHHGFMDQALDMVCLALSCFYHLSSKPFIPTPTPYLFDCTFELSSIS